MPVLGSPPSGLTLLFHKAVSNAHVHTLTAQLEPFIDRLLFIYFLVGRGGGAWEQNRSWIYALSSTPFRPLTSASNSALLMALVCSGLKAISYDFSYWETR